MSRGNPYTGPSDGPSTTYTSGNLARITAAAAKKAEAEQAAKAGCTATGTCSVQGGRRRRRSSTRARKSCRRKTRKSRRV